MVQNPFYVGGPVPPKYFVGRQHDVDTAFDQILRHCHLAIWGGSGIGKSSLLKFLAAPQTWQAQGHNPSEAFIVYLNCQSIYPFSSSAFWREVLSLIKDQVDSDVTLQGKIDQVLQQSTVTKDDLRLVLRRIGRQNKFLVLLLDDYDAALHPQESYTEKEMEMFLSEIRTLSVYSPESQYLSTIVTSFRRLNELGPKLTISGSPWYNHYRFHLLKPFTNDEVASLFCLPISKELRDGVSEIAYQHPALLQTAGYLLYKPLQFGETPDFEMFTRDFQSSTEHFFHNTWKFSTDAEKMLMMLMALSRLEGRLNRKRLYDLGDIDLVLSQRGHEMRSLEEQGVIYCEEEQGKNNYYFTSSIMEWWVIKEIENSNEANLDARQKVFLNLNRKQADQIKKVVNQVWQNKDAVTSLASWTGKLAGSFTKGFTQT